MLKKAFTLIEMIVVITLIGVMATIIIPRISRRKPNTEWSSVVQDINNLIFLARQEAMANHKIHRLVFKADEKGPHEVYIEDQSPSVNKPGEYSYKTVTSLYAKTRYEFPDVIKINAVFLGKKDLLLDNGNKGYCYIVPDGLVQEIFVRMTRREEGNESKVTLKTLPFLGECTYDDGHLKSE